MASSPYVYSHLCSLPQGFHSNFYGVLSSVALPSRVRNDKGTSKFHCCLGVTDPSLSGDSIPIIVFGDSFASFPSLHCLGMIIRCHRFKVAMWNGKPQASSNFNSSWIILDPSACDDVITPVQTSSAHYTFTDLDRKHIQDLRSWLSKEVPLPHSLLSAKDQYRRSIQDVTLFAKFDLWFDSIA